MIGFTKGASVEIVRGSDMEAFRGRVFEVVDGPWLLFRGRGFKTKPKGDSGVAERWLSARCPVVKICCREIGKVFVRYSVNFLRPLAGGDHA